MEYQKITNLPDTTFYNVLRFITKKYHSLASFQKSIVHLLTIQKN